jgi:hypothetical protein
MELVHLLSRTDPERSVAFYEALASRSAASSRSDAIVNYSSASPGKRAGPS